MANQQCYSCGKPISPSADICPNCHQPLVLHANYRIVQILGQGGFGVVYEAIDTRFNRRCAIKAIVSPSHAQQRQVQAEAMILAQHAQRLHFIPDVYDIWSDKGQTFIVMEYIDGQTLDMLAPCSPIEVEQFLRTMLDYLVRMHAAGIVHRDIKPSNIKRTSDGRYVLLDFGIAKQGAATLSAAKALSKGYAPPEQLKGEPTDARSDLFSLAATAYYLLLARPPESTEVRLATGASPQPPSQMVANVSPALETTLLWMLKLDPKNRPSDAKAALMLMDSLATPTVTVSTPASGISFKRFSRYSKVILSVFAVITIGFIAVMVAGRSDSHSPIPISTADLQPSLSPTTVQAIPASTSTNIVSLCGESGRILDPDATRFLRNQGVSAFTVANTQGAVLNDHVRTVLIDPRGLWIGYFATAQNPSNGLGYYDKKSWANCNRPEGTAGKNINSIAVDRMGRVWVALERAGVAVFDRNEWITYTMNDGLPSNDVFEITVDRDNNIWVGTWEGVAKFSGKVWNVPYSIQNNTLYDNHVYKIVFDNSDNIWVGYINQGVSQYSKSSGKWTHYVAKPNGLGGNEIRGIVAREAKGGSPESVWFATADGGVSKFEQGTWTVYRVQDGLPSDNVRAVAIDKHDRIWAATAGGVAYFDDVKWITYTTIDTLSLAFGPNCQTCPFNDDHVWTGTANSGLTHSRIPYPDEAIDIVEVKYPKVVAPGEKFSPEIVVAPRRPYQLREDRGDFLAVTNESDIALFSIHPHIGVTGVAESGQPYRFVDKNKPVIAPQLDGHEQEKTYMITYRVWMHTRYAGPYIRITFTVRRPQATPTPSK
jgi:serine/threonine protein kinase